MNAARESYHKLMRFVRALARYLIKHYRGKELILRAFEQAERLPKMHT